MKTQAGGSNLFQRFATGGAVVAVSIPPLVEGDGKDEDEVNGSSASAEASS